MIALVQTDLKRLAAYSTLGHLSFCILGIFSFTIAGMDGSIYQILNHGISGGALFMLMGMLYERYHTYDMRDLGGIAQKMPWMITLFVITTLSLIGLPMLNGFVGEFLILSGTFPVNMRWTAVATLGVILGAAYMLWMIQRVFYGHLGPKPRAVAAGIVLPDLGAREQISLWPLVVLMLVMGLASPYWMRAIDGAGIMLADKPAVAAAPHVVVLSSATFAPADDTSAAGANSAADAAKGGK